MKKSFFFDRDGIINEQPPPGGYVTRWEDFRLMPGIVSVLKAVSRLGYEVVVVTNQRGVSLGLMTSADVERIHANLRDLLEKEHDVRLLDVFYCPHPKGTCDCRKPKPGMILEAARKHDIDISRSWIVGDSPRDVEAGKRSGCGTILVGGHDAEGALPDYTVPDLKALESLILNVIKDRRA